MQVVNGVLRCLLVISLGLLIGVADGQTGVIENSSLQARQRIGEFESGLLKQRPVAQQAGDMPDSPEIDRAVRKFFKDLDSSPMRIAAMDLLDNRYVYVVNRALVVELLEPLMRDEDPAVVSRAVRAVAYNKCGQHFAKELITLSEQDNSPRLLIAVANAMAGSGDVEFTSHLIRLTHHSDGSVRSAALTALTSLAPRSAVEPGSRLQLDRDPKVRRSAVQDLAVISGDDSIQAAERMLRDSDASVRERAIWTLGQLASARSADRIAEHLTDRNDHVRAQAASVLASMQSARHADAIANLMTDESIVVRRYAIQAVGNLGQPGFIPRLSSFLDDRDEQIRRLAAESIRSLSQKAGEASLSPAKSPS